MTESEITNIIELICQKIGIAVQSGADLVPIIADYKIAIHVFGVVIPLLLSAIFSLLIVALLKTSLKNMLEDACLLGAAIGFLLILICVCIGISIWNGYELVCWSVAPEAKALLWVTEQLG